eukprot:ANDGO_04490.mRNA.1 hypothetical protein SDRG_09648
MHRWSRVPLSGLVSLAHEAACKHHRGDVYLLGGDLGAGKTTFARYFLQRVFADVDPELHVSSPTYNLRVEYRHPKTSIEYVHIDAYRLDPCKSSNARLGLTPDSLAHAVHLIEWFEHLDPALLAGARRLHKWTFLLEEGDPEGSHRQILYKKSEDGPP